jgi:hypothetical protein
MAVIYLKHPIHGHKVACNDLEAEYDENYGWERYTIDTPIVEETAVEESVVEELETEIEAAPANALEVKTRRRKTTA